MGKSHDLYHLWLALAWFSVERGWQHFCGPVDPSGGPFGMHQIPRVVVRSIEAVCVPC